MQPIPLPQVLDPDRVLGHNADTEFMPDQRPEAELVKIALHESCGYAQQLWHELDQVRTYLMQSLPPDSYRSGSPLAGVHPTGPNDDDGWRNWTSTFAAVTSVLCGPYGDSGYGQSEAVQAERRCRRIRSDGPTETSGAMQLARQHWSGRQLLLSLALGGFATYRLLRRRAHRLA
jgi:hypothetical protein